jgi:hypothetical protein
MSIEGWREDETFSEFKARKRAESGTQGMGQKTVKKRDNCLKIKKEDLEINKKVAESKI